MRRGWKILIGALVALAILLTVNTIVLDQETKAAEVTVSGGRILDLPGGAVQVVEQGPTVAKLPRVARGDSRFRPPIVLLHCFGCSLHWWDRMVPLLAKRHRVIRIDLLGFGGSEKPKSGYSMEEQGRLVALALGKLRVQGAVVVGHSMGFDVATALAAESSELVDRLVNIDEAPDPSFGDLPFTARLTFTPVLGQALRRTAPDFAIEDGYESAFAPGYDLADFSDQIIDDYKAMTYTSYDRSAAEADDYEDELPLDQRVRDRRRAAAGDLRRGGPALRRPRGGRRGLRRRPRGADHDPPRRRPLAERRDARSDLPSRPRVRGGGGRLGPTDIALTGSPTASCPPLSPTRPDGPPRRSRRRRGARPGGGRAGRGPRRAPSPHCEQLAGPSSTDGDSVISPASQCGPRIAHGTTCSRRQNAARRSPLGS